MSGCPAEMALHIHKGLPNGTASLGAPSPSSTGNPLSGWGGWGQAGWVFFPFRQKGEPGLRWRDHPTQDHPAVHGLASSKAVLQPALRGSTTLTFSDVLIL